MTTTPTPICQACTNYSPVPQGNRMISLCGLTGVNAYAERANPNGCGPTAKNFIKRGVAPAPT